MHIDIVCIGKLKEKYWNAAIEEYEKRLKSYCTLNIIELKEERLPENAGLCEMKNVKVAEGNAIIKTIKSGSYTVALVIKGRQLDSLELALKLENLRIEGKSHITFIIGGSLGLSDEVIAQSDYILSFSLMTFPHQLIRVILLEQIYRCFKISRNEPYHK